MFKKIFGSAPPVSILEHPSAEQSVCAGQTATLSIIAGGPSSIKYEWQFSPDSTSDWSVVTGPRFEGVSSSQLTVQNAQSSDGGRYRCVIHARHQQPTISDTAILNVVSLPVISEAASSEERVVVWGDASLHVETTGQGRSLSYQWQWKPPQELTVEDSGKGGGGGGGGDEERKGEGGYGWCVGEVCVIAPDKALSHFYPTLRKHFNVQSAFAYLRKHGLITPDQHEKLLLPSTNAEKVDQLMVWLPQQGHGHLEKFIRCLRETASDVPVHSEIADQIEEALFGKHTTTHAKSTTQERSQKTSAMEWTVLCDDSRIHGSQDSCLRIGHVCESDAGAYRCQVSNLAGTTYSAPVELVVVGFPKITVDLEDVKAAPQDRVTLAVRAVSGGELTYNWERKLENCTEWQALSDGERYQGQGTSSLMLVGVEAADVGVYRCHVSSEAGKTWTKEAVLSVEEPVKIKLHPTNTSVVVSNSLTLCVEASCSDPLTYTWQKRSTESNEDEWEPISVAPSNTTSAMFTVKEVTESDAGEFRCVVRSKTGASAISQPATVTVLTIEQVVSEFTKKCKTVEDVGDLVVSFVKEHGTSSEVTKAALLALVQGEADSHEAIKAMLNFNVSLDVQQDGFGLLHWTCIRGHTKSVEVLLDSGIDLNPPTKASTQENRVSSPLHLAAEGGHCEIVTLLLKRCSDASFINARDKMGQTALHVAIKAIGACSPENEEHLMLRLTETIRILLDSHARTDIQDLETQTALHLAASAGHKQVMCYLLKRDRNAIGSCDNGKNTALHIACCERNFQCVSAILDYPEGCHIIDKQNEDGNTALHLACAGDYKEICSLLLRKGASKFIKNKAGKTPEGMSRTGLVLDEGQRHFSVGSYLTHPKVGYDDNTFRTRSATPPGNFVRPTKTSSPPGKDDSKMNLDSEETDPLPAYSEHEVQENGTKGRMQHETLGEILCLDQDMAGFKGTMPNYQSRVQSGAPHRELVKQGPLVKYSRKTTCQRFFFLFTDVLIHTEELGEGRYLFKGAMPIHYMLVKECSAHSDSPLCFDVFSVTRSLLLMAKSLGEKEEWLEVLGKCIGDYNSAIGRNPIQSDQHLVHTPIFEPDVNVTKCQLCRSGFTFINRKHHCRACGKAVCNSCSRGRAVVTNKDNPTRVCKECFESKPSSNTSQDEVVHTSRGVLERQAGTVETTVKRGHVMCLQTNTRMWFELDPEGVLYIYKAARDVTAEKSLPILGYQLLTNQRKFELKLSHPTGGVVFSVDDLQEFNQWKMALEKVLFAASEHAP